MQTYWNPWSIFDELERSLVGTTRVPEWPVFEIEDSDDDTILSADVPGMTDEDLEITVSGTTLTVRGERKVRRPRGAVQTFERRFRIAAGYDLDEVTAHVAHGVLTIRLAKAATARPRRIKLTTGVVDKVKGLLTGGRDKDKHQAA
jgi:HSP20 family protein